jgi:4-hydroxyphenylpyruvate dioxygenase
VAKSTLKTWASFYQSVFGFEEVRSFEIRGEQTGLTSYALRSPCGHFCIPINEADEQKSQINEYLEEYQGPGIQHLALRSDDLLGSLRQLEGTPIALLDIDAEYYADLWKRFPHLTQDKGELQRRNVLVDGDEEGYLLQLFTKNLIGPMSVFKAVASREPQHGDQVYHRNTRLLSTRYFCSSQQTVGS